MNKAVSNERSHGCVSKSHNVAFWSQSFSAAIRSLADSGVSIAFAEALEKLIFWPGSPVEKVSSPTRAGD
jgi:hypothetical protein